MARLGAEGVEDTPQVPDTSDMDPKRAPDGMEAVGGHVSIHFAGVGIWCRGEVLAYDASREVIWPPLKPGLGSPCSSWEHVPVHSCIMSCNS